MLRDPIVSEYDKENDNITDKVASNTVNNNNITCDECGANFADEDELYDEYFWFNHRSNVCNIRYAGCHTKPSENPQSVDQLHVITAGHII